MAVERNGVYIWASWLAKLMTGEMPCWWSGWFRAHYTRYPKQPGDFNLAKWTADHSRVVHALTTERELAGETVTVESQNSFQYVSRGITIAGKPDVIARSGEAATIYDLKTGKPRLSDQMQVLLYMLLLPQARGEYKGLQLQGCVVYEDHRATIPLAALDAQFKENVRYFAQLMSSDTAPRKVPSAQSCWFCDIAAAACAERVATALAEPGDETQLGLF